MYSLTESSAHIALRTLLQDIARRSGKRFKSFDTKRIRLKCAAEAAINGGTVAIRQLLRELEDCGDFESAEKLSGHMGDIAALASNRGRIHE